MKKYDYIFLNSYMPNELINVDFINSLKIVFITHSDVAYSNCIIEKYHRMFYKIITVNNYTKKKLIDLLYIPEKKIIKLINYIEPEALSIIHKNKKLNKKFGVITRFSHDKNIVMLIYSLRNFFKQNTDYQCHLVGFENEEIQIYLIEIVKYLHLEKYIIFEGYQEDIVKYYTLFDFIILPSVSEGCPYNLLEAMNLGIPIITTDVGGNHEILSKDSCLFINYEGMKEFEKKTLCIKNYNDQLEIIGYYKNINMNNNDNNFNFTSNIDYDIHKSAVIPPFLRNINNNWNINIRNDIKKQLEIWEFNSEKIIKCIHKMIYLTVHDKQNMINTNIDFMNNEFNEQKYLDSIINIFDLYQ